MMRVNAKSKPSLSAAAPKPRAPKPPTPTENPSMKPVTAPTYDGAASEDITTITDQLAKSKTPERASKSMEMRPDEFRNP